MRKHRDIKLVATEIRRNYLVSELNYHTAKFFTGNLLAIEMKKTEILMNKPVCLGLSILELSKILMLSFGMIMQSQNIEKKQDCDIWIQTVLLYT